MGYTNKTNPHYSNAHLMTSNSFTNVVTKIKARLQLTNADTNEINKRRQNSTGEGKNEAKPLFKNVCDLELDI